MRKSRRRCVSAILLAVVTALSHMAVFASAQAAGSAELFVKTAVKELNYFEEADGSTKYGVAFGSPMLDAWDTAFVAWCAHEAGVSSDVIPNYTDAQSLLTFFKSKGLYAESFAHGGSYLPKEGDIAFLSRTSDPRALSRVAIVEDYSYGEVTLIEGDAPNRVRRNYYDDNNKTIIGYGATQFPTDPQDTPIDDTPKYDTGIYQLNENMNLRSDHAATAEILTVIPKDTVVLVDQISGEWGHTTYNNFTGWMSLAYSKVIGDAETKYAIGKYRTDYRLNFRSAPKEDAENVIGAVPAGTIVTVTEISSTWGQTEYEGKTGWISLEYCTVYSPGANDPTPATPTTPTDTSPTVDWLVLDISSHNAVGYFDWAKMKEAGVMGVIIRVGGRGYGSGKSLYNDTAFYQHYQGAKSVGMHVGAYFFSYALTEAEAREEAQMTIDTLRSYNAELDMPVYIDLEDYAESDYVDYQHQNAGKDVCMMVVNTFCDMIEEAGYYPGIYTNKYFAETLYDVSVFEGRALWLAQYNDTCTYTASPIGMWQYGASGNISGYSGQYVDVNRCYVNYPALIGTTGYKGHTNPNPTPAGGEEKQPDTNVAEREPTVTRTWELTKAPTCTEDGVESIFEGPVVYVKKAVKACHSDPVKCALRDSYLELQAGDYFDLYDNAGRYYDENSPYYDDKYADIKNNGGCLFQYCPDCYEILQVDYCYKSGCRHDYQETVVSAATCTKEGLTKAVCSKCGKTGYESVVPRKDHVAGVMQYYPESNGVPSYYGIICYNCGKLIYISYNSIAGDVDGNMKVDASDARLTLRHAIGLEMIDLSFQRNADMNNDGRIDSADARLILRKSVHLD